MSGTDYALDDGPASHADALPTLTHIPGYHAVRRPDAIALIFEGRRTSYAALERGSNRVAHALTAARIAAGDRIAYAGKNSDHFFEILFGAAKAGVVLTAVGWRLAPAEMAYVLDDADAKLVFADRDAMTPIMTALATRQDPPVVIALDSDYAAWRDDHADRALPVEQVGPAAVILQLYTSGTTGKPKGVLLTHDNMLSVWRAAQKSLDWCRWTADDVSLVTTPITHIGGSAWGLQALVNGASAIVARDFDPAAVLDMIAHDGLSKMFVVPAMLQALLNQPNVRAIDYSRVKYILYGASPIPLDMLRECVSMFGCGLCQNYGMTETAGTIVYLPPEDHDSAGSARMRSAGRAMPGVELRILDGDGHPLPPGSIGEIATRSRATMAGYWKLPDATAAVLDAEGWLRTGDIGILDADGYLTIHDRVKDMIITGGENVYCSEVESAIYGHPHVADVAVIGVPDEKWGEAVKAIVVAKPGVVADPADIIAYARARIAAFKAPKSVDFIDALPRNPSGKVLRRELREPYWAGRTRRVN